MAARRKLLLCVSLLSGFGLFGALVGFLLLPSSAIAQNDDDYHSCPTLRIERIGDGPIIHAGLKGLEGKLDENINGSALMRVPDWVQNPLGKYYLYFAHHKGKFIRLAYADNIRGPWRIHVGGVLALESAPGLRDHVASPDIYIDEKNKLIQLYFHGVKSNAKMGYKDPQATYVALSDDGLRFIVKPQEIGPPYLRVFKYRQKLYAVVKTANGGEGSLARAPGLFQPFERGPVIIKRMRHAAVFVPRGAKAAIVAYTRIGDAPEAIYYSCVQFIGPFEKWEATKEHLLLRPERDYEGANMPIIPSEENFIMGAVNQLRDPAFYVEKSDKLYLLYANAGESGISLAEVKQARPGSLSKFLGPIGRR